MNILMTGGTGFIGRHLVPALVNKGHVVYILTRRDNEVDSENVRYIKWLDGSLPDLAVVSIDICINLAGAGIADKRWTAERKQLILDSRVDATTELVRIIHDLNPKPRLLINASAIGVYPTSQTTFFLDTEEHVAADNFLSETVISWEKAARASGIRTVFTRFGLILGKDGGSLPLLTKQFAFLIGGPLGEGNQWYSWIHIDDVVAAILFIMDSEQFEGPVNVTAPHPVQQKKFAELLGQAMKRPAKVATPASMIRLAMGERALLILEGQRVYPQKLLNQNFTFQFPQIEEALADLVQE
ncbi:TIGR01777 family oxidoreductase [Listeria newyorkensis]|uniref:TIGR01777 family protein n=1 Tax=Listeria newyorkensis TaxID=1497681 RepID=A0A841YXJ5_9LIST|nr:TIGR01777 family oxidoreductase [Listeria newyorkensis]MBC1458254.1 TIGR01777 family protein [Listeria newyorkensis]